MSSFHGGCLCGAVRFEARDLSNLCFCYCNSCRRAAGAPVVPWGTVERAAFILTQGTLRETRSSKPVLRGFCGECGTSLTYRHDEKPNELDVALATLDEQESVRPECHLWVEHKPSWMTIADGLPQFARGRTGADATPPRLVRPGYGAISARIVVEDAAGLVEFVQHVFEARGQPIPGAPAELRIADNTLLISEPGPRASSPAFLYVYVDNVDATHQRALGRAARQLEAPIDTPYGDRRSMVEDAWGNTWQIATYQLHNT